MKQSSRIFLRVVTFISAILVIATMTEWVRTDENRWWVNRGGPDSYFEIQSWRGRVLVTFIRCVKPPPGWAVHSFPRDIESPRGPMSRGQMHIAFGIGIGSGSYSPRPGNTYFSVSVAYWVLVLFFWIAPLIYVLAMAWRLRQLKARFAKLECVKCGYDLRASRERCPECGTPIA